MYDSKERIALSSGELSDYGAHLSGGDALTLLEVVRESLSCNSKRDFIALYSKLQELLSFDYANAILGYYDGNRVIVSDFGINVSMPREWVREYVSRNFLQKDPIVRENFLSYKAQYWSDSKKRLDQIREIDSLFNDFGMREGYTHGSRFMAAGIYGSKFCFSSPSMKYDRRTMAILDLIVPHLHLALCNLNKDRRPETKGVSLTLREKEVLNWLRQGKTSWDISAILKISERTVNFHVYNIMEKLGATNRPQAVAIATRLGLIDLN